MKTDPKQKIIVIKLTMKYYINKGPTREKY